MLILISIDVQYLQNAVFSFDEGSNGQNHSSLSSRQLVEKFPPAKLPIPHTGVIYPYPLFAVIWKTLKYIKMYIDMYIHYIYMYIYIYIYIYICMYIMYICKSYIQHYDNTP